MTNKNDIRNYFELRDYQEGSNTSDITRKNIIRVFNKLFGKKDSSKPFRMLDVGSGNGNLSLPFVCWVKQKFKKFHYTAVEPELPAFEKLNESIKENKISYAEIYNLKFEEYLKAVGKNNGLHDFILFSQSWYHFPKEEWKVIIKNVLSLLKKNGIILIVMDSHLGEAYKLKDLITKGKADTLKFGGLYSAEDLENFLSKEGIRYSTEKFPVYMFTQDSERKLFVLARRLAFLYRTFPEKILKKYKNELKKFLEASRMTGKYYVLENLVRMIIIRKQS